MKYCPKCGNPAEDHAGFCANCGAGLIETAPIAAAPEDAPPPPPPVPEPASQPEDYSPDSWAVPAPPPFVPPSAPAPPPPMYGMPAPDAPPPPFMESPAVSVFKRFASSGLFLGVAVLYTFIILFSFISAFAAPMDMDWVIDILDEMDVDTSDLEDLLDEYYATDVSAISVTSTLFGMIPSILICIGLWLIYSAGRSKTPFVPTTGLSMLRGIAIFNLVIMCLAVVAILLFGVFFLVLAQDSYGYDETTFIAVAVVFFIMAFIFILPILYYAFLSSTIRSIRISLVTGHPMVKISSFVIAANFITAGSSIIGIFSSLVLLASVGANGIFVLLTILSSLCNIIFTFMLTISLLKYKSAMSSMLLQQSIRGSGTYPTPQQPGFPPPPPPYTNPYDVYQAQADPYQTGRIPQEPPQPGEYVFCHACSKQYGADVIACPHCGTPRNP